LQGKFFARDAFEAGRGDLQAVRAWRKLEKLVKTGIVAAGLEMQTTFHVLENDSCAGNHAALRVG